MEFLGLPYASVREIAPRCPGTLLRWRGLGTSVGRSWRGVGSGETLRENAAVTRILVLGGCDTCLYNGLECSIRERVGG